MLETLQGDLGCNRSPSHCLLPAGAYRRQICAVEFCHILSACNSTSVEAILYP